MPLSNPPSGLARLLIAPLTAAVAFAMLAACSKAPEPGNASPSPTPPANTLAPVLAPAASTPPASVPEATASPEAMASPKDAKDDEDDSPPVAQLQQKYFSSQDEDQRTEIISQIGDKDNLEAIQTLTRIFVAEPSADLRTQILSVSADLGDDDAPGIKDAKLQIYTSALTGSQPEDVRETAVDGLEQLTDPRTIALWQRLLSDPDEDIRDSAQAAIDRYKEQSQP